MNTLQIIFPIAIGALIGYCTNYIAIKMLFHPRREVRMGEWKLPFTPGVIPKNQGRLARAAGTAVGNNLLTKEDIKEALKAPQIEEAVADAIMDAATGTEYTFGQCLEKISGGSADGAIDKASVFVTEKIKHGLEKVDFAELVVNVAAPALMEKVQGTMLAMFVNEGTLASFAAPIGNAIEDYVAEKGVEMIFPMVRDELGEMKGRSVHEMIESSGINFEVLKDTIKDIYGKMIDEKSDAFLKHFDVAGLVEAKINAMDVEELEELVMSVMKHELQTVINLGAVIGAVIGTLNIFI